MRLQPSEGPESSLRKFLESRIDAVLEVVRRGCPYAPLGWQAPIEAVRVRNRQLQRRRGPRSMVSIPRWREKRGSSKSVVVTRRTYG